MLALLCGGTAAPSALAQSGRHKTPATQRPSQTSGQTPSTRPRTVNTSRQGAPRAVSARDVPSDPAQLGEPPALPTPKPTPAQAAKTEDEIDASDVIRVNSNLVTVPASVIDPTGRAVTDLKLEDFELRVDGQPRPISDLSFADSPVRMALLFDNSRSLTSAREFEKQAAVRFFKSVLRPQDQAMIYSVATDVIIKQPMTSDVQALVRTIEHFPEPEGATALLQAIVDAAAYLKPHQEGRRVIVIVSDGADTISDIDFETTLRRAQAADCQIFAVQTGQIENANLHDLAAERRLQEFTSQTGGAVYVPHGTNDLDQAFRQIAADLSQQYVLSYYPEDEQKDGRFRTISVRVTTRPNLRVRARKGYYAMPGQKQAWLQNTTTTPGAQTKLVNRNETAARLDQSSTVGTSGAEPEANGKTETSGGNTRAPIYLRANNAASASRVGPRGPTDDAVGASEAKRGEPDSSNTYEASPPAAAASERSSTPPPATAKPAPSQTQSPANAPDRNTERRPEPRAESTAQKAQESKQPSSSSQPPADDKQAPTAPVSGGVLNGKAISLPKPVYPLAAKCVGAGGTVIVEVTLDESGKVISARALSGHTLLQAPCVAAARQARFSPTLISGRAVKVLGTITYNFVLN